MTSQLGMGVMIQMLSGNKGTAESVTKALNKYIQRVELTDDRLTIHFTLDSSSLTLYDDGQSCCESRYMRTDDNLGDFIGAQFLGAEIREAPDYVPAAGEYCDEHEVQFLVILTDRGNLTVSTHNEHNGYYGGFAIVATFKEGSDGIESKD